MIKTRIRSPEGGLAGRDQSSYMKIGAQMKYQVWFTAQMCDSYKSFLGLSYVSSGSSLLHLAFICDNSGLMYVTLQGASQWLLLLSLQWKNCISGKRQRSKKDKIVLKKQVYFFRYLLLNTNFSLLRSFTLKSSKYNQALIKCSCRVSVLKIHKEWADVAF